MPVEDVGKGARAGRRVPRAIWVTAAVVALLTAGAVWWGVAGSGGRPAAAPPAPSPSPEGPRYFLLVDLRRVDAVPIEGQVRRHEVRAVAEDVRATMTGVYSTGFVDPALWQGGRFPALFDYFAGYAREEVRGDLSDLTLGPAARRLEVVRPERARLGVRVLVGTEGRALSAIASMEFAATGLAGQEEVPIRQRGRFVLRPIDGRWLIAAYDVQGRLGTGGRG
jgi:hypothetical protein